MEAYEEHLATKQEGYILVVDDLPTTRAIHSLMLSRYFEVKNASSGQEALDLCAQRMPDLVLLDVEMPGLNGFETCRKLRETCGIPIIFATAHESLEEHLKAFDAGGSDLCVKPVSAEILVRKARLAISQWRARLALNAEKASLKAIADQYQSSMSERKQLLQFTRTALHAESYEQLAHYFLRASDLLGVQCCITIRHDDTEPAWSQDGEATALERAVLTQIASMGRLVQFRNRLAVNCDRVSVVVSNMPDEESDAATRIRDNMATLVEMAAALADNLAVRLAKEPAAAAPAHSSDNDILLMQRKMVSDVSQLLQEIVDNLEVTFDWLATDKRQEDRINEAVRNPIERIRVVLEHSTRLAESLAAAPASTPPPQN